MRYETLGNFVSLSQGLVVNKSTESLFSDKKDDEFVYPLLRITDFENGNQNNPSKYVSRNVPQKVVIDERAILFTRVTCQCFRGFSGVFHNNLFRVELISDEITEDYLYVVLRSEYVQKQALKFAASSVVPDLTHDLFKLIQIPVPSIEQQKNIANTYLYLQSKIDGNDTICSDLEAMAKLLYDYWFVQFDFPDENGKPYKSSGGKMVWNEDLKREIPEGWEVKKLPEVASLLYGFPLSTEQFGNEGIGVVRIRDIVYNSISALTTESVGDEYYTHEGDLLVGMDGNFQMNYWTRNGDVVNQRIARIRKQLLPIMIIKMQIEPYINAKISRVARSTVGHLGDSDFKDQLILVSRNINLQCFDTMLSEIIELRNENQQLASLRDFLLPMLMNGQVKVGKGDLSPVVYPTNEAHDDYLAAAEPHKEYDAEGKGV